MSKFCNQCGKSLKPNSKFCPGCGKSFSQNINISLTSYNSTKHEHDDNINLTLFVIPSYALKILENIFKRRDLQNIKILSIDNPGLAHDKVREYLNINSTNIKYMCLIGNWDDLPPYRIPNPADTDFDQYCLNDSLYGSKEDFDNNPLNCIPEIIVGRIPIVEEVILENLLFSKFAFKKFNESFYFSISAECWLEATNAILFNIAQKSFANNLNPNIDKGGVDKGILSSPHWQENNLSQYFNNYRPEMNSLLLFNVHGGADTPEWVGESNQREVIEIFKVPLDFLLTNQNMRVQNVGSMFHPVFTDLDEITNYRDFCKTVDLAKYAEFAQLMRDQGIFFSGNKILHNLSCTEHTQSDIDASIDAAGGALEKMSKNRSAE